jgi:hypothetical protein
LGAAPTRWILIRWQAALGIGGAPEPFIFIAGYPPCNAFGPHALRFQAAEIVAGSQYLRDGDIATIRAIARDTARRLGGHFVLMDRSGRHLINTRLEPPAQLGTTQNSRPLDAALAEAGFEIAHTAASVRGALRALPAIECDVAVLDVNLRGESIEPVALTLRDRRIPYLFATGYGSDAIPTEFADARVVPKPVDAAVMAREIMRLLNT